MKESEIKTENLQMWYLNKEVLNKTLTSILKNIHINIKCIVTYPKQEQIK